METNVELSMNKKLITRSKTHNYSAPNPYKTISSKFKIQLHIDMNDINMYWSVVTVDTIATNNYDNKIYNLHG